MRYLIVGMVLLLACGVAGVMVHSLASKRNGLASVDRPSRNHLNMARWIERVVRDEMVRVTIDERERAIGNALIDEFFGTSGDRKELK